MRTSGTIWYENPSILFTYDTYTIVLPTGNMTLEEKLNAIVRFSIYLSILLALFKSDSRFISIAIVVCVITIVIHKYYKQQKKETEKFLEEKKLDVIGGELCSRSTVDNPFMNPSIIDITDNPTHPPACSWDNDRVKETIENNFNAKLFRDSGDLFDRMASQRQFYTMPSTTIPNDQTGFANWVYKGPKTCKEDNLECTGLVYR